MALGMRGKYERLDVLGHGASGIVYLAKDTLLGRQVALKEVSAQGEDKERILGEARVLDRLRHPNIVEVVGVDEIDGRVVIAMEYVRGQSLLELLRQTPQMSIGNAIHIAAQVCDGLAYAHAHRTVHRDVKPANILVDRDGVVKLVDFGLAEVLGTHSLAGGAGTYAYMAPEDFHEEEQSDRQSDIWAVGVIVFEMVAGRRPFQVAKAKDPFAWRRVIEEDIVIPVTSLRSDAPAALNDVIARALAADKSVRYQDAGEMAHDLRQLELTSGTEYRQYVLDASTADRAPSQRLTFLDQPTVAALPSVSPRDLSITLSDFPGVRDIDGFLHAAVNQWPDACAALVSGDLAQWLAQIGETPLADVAQQIANTPDLEDDDRLRDFLYRAGLETSEEARRYGEEGERLYNEGSFADAATQLRNAVRLNPSDAASYQMLSQALSNAGDKISAATAFKEANARLPLQRIAPNDQYADIGLPVILSTDRVDFGVMRIGQSRSARVTVRSSGGVMSGRVASSPGWIQVAPAAFTTRHRQPLVFTANSIGVWQAPASYEEAVVLETSGGRQEITVLASILPARLTLMQVVHWYFPMLLCCLLPTVAGFFANWLAYTAPNHFPHHPGLRQLWQPGLVASGLLCGSAFVLAYAADTVWSLRLLPLGLICLCAGGFTNILGNLDSSGEQITRLAVVQTSVPIVALLVLQAIAIATDSHGWGRWQIWRWIVGATGLLISYALLHMG